MLQGLNIMNTIDITQTTVNATVKPYKPATVAKHTIIKEKIAQAIEDRVNMVAIRVFPCIDTVYIKRIQN